MLGPALLGKRGHIASLMGMLGLVLGLDLSGERAGQGAAQLADEGGTP